MDLSQSGMVGIDIWNYAQTFCPHNSVIGVYSIDDLRGKTLPSGCAMVINTGSKYSRQKYISLFLSLPSIKSYLESPLWMVERLAPLCATQVAWVRSPARPTISVENGFFCYPVSGVFPHLEAWIRLGRGIL
jgi:hypothetical protein